MNLKVILLTLGLFVLTSNQSAHALIDVPTFRMGFGHSFINFTAGTLFPESTKLDPIISLKPMFLWDIPSVRTRLGLHFLADIGSQYGSFPNSGVGVTAIFYPLGLSSSREVKEDYTIIVKNRISPYFQLQFTPNKSSISDPTRTSTPSNPNYFAALILETSAGIGVDYPYSEDATLFMGLHYRFASFTSQETSIGSIKYSGIELLTGIMTNFY